MQYAEYLDTAREMAVDFNKSNPHESGGEWAVPDDSLLECPHGHSIEWDGECYDGCVSFMRQLGMI
jgi:hypothetical protein